MADEEGTAIGVAVLGLGNVGSQVVRIIEESAADLGATGDAVPPALLPSGGPDDLPGDGGSN